MKNKTKSILLSTTIIVMAMLTGCSSGSKKVTIDLNDYVTVSASGYEGNGTADFTFYKTELIDDYKDQIEYSNTLKSEAKSKTDKDRADFILNDDTTSLKNLPVIVSLENADAIKVANASDDADAKYLSRLIAADIDMYNEYTPADMLSKFLSCSMVDKTEELSNGDVITVSLNSASQLEEYFNVRFENNPVKYTVSELYEIETVDPFEGVDVAFSGTAPNGTASVVKTAATEVNSLLTYSVEPDFNLNNGDTVTVNITEYDADQLQRHMGIRAYPLSKEYTVEGLGYYAASLSQIPSDTRDKMNAQARDVISSKGYYAGYSHNVDILGVSYLGSFFLTSKNIPLSGHPNNSCYLVYLVNTRVNNTNGFIEGGKWEGDYDYYTFVRYDDAKFLADGAFTIDLDSYTLCENKINHPNSTSVNFYGFNSLESLFDYCVSQNDVEYNYESTVPGYEKSAEVAESFSESIPETTSPALSPESTAPVTPTTEVASEETTAVNSEY